jgi:hypothetical protein
MATLATKTGAHYNPQASEPTERCVRCVHFISPSRCDRVAGLIRPGGWCKYFKAVAEGPRTAERGR